MKKFYLLPALLIAACSHKAPSYLTAQLDQLLYNKEYFKLEKALQTLPYDLPAGSKTFYAAYLDNAFNKNEACVTTVD